VVVTKGHPLAVNVQVTGMALPLPGWLGHPLKVEARVRTPLGLPAKGQVRGGKADR